MNFLFLLPSLMILLCALFPPANFWVRLLVVFLAFAIQALIFQNYSDINPNPLFDLDPTSKSSTSYAENYPD